MNTSKAWLKRLSLIVAFAFCTMLVAPVATAQDYDSAQEGGTASNAGLGAAGLLLTIPYGAAKVAFALGGGVVGGLAYLFSGGNEQTAQDIWTTSMYGTYVITPAHLKGDKAVRFLGVPEDNATDQYADGDY